MTQGLSFGPVADLYDQIRPTYPAAAMEWALGPQPRRVVDLGAGTGILTRVLLGLGHEVVPVEPDEAMRARLVRSTPAVTPLAGSAERIPLPDGSVDAVVAGQAYHWFDPEPAHREIARVLRPGGVFAPVWNIRDESEPWVAALSRIAEGAEGAGSGVHEGWLEHDFGPDFGPVERELFPFEVQMDADGLVRLIGSRSYYLTASPERRTEIEADVRELAAGLPETFALPYVTVTYRRRR
jgi:SAM-dependent methyltransferase